MQQPFKQRSLKQAAKEGIAKKANTSLPAQKPIALPPKAPGQKPEPDIVGYETHIRDGEQKGNKGCGCSGQFPLYRSEKPEYTVARLAKWKSKPCEACRLKREEEQRQKALLPKKTRSSHLHRPDSDPEKARLPHGSGFQMIYDATKMEWNGTLTIIENGGGAVFTDNAGALFTLCARLDWQYRKWQKSLKSGEKNPG